MELNIEKINQSLTNKVWELRNVDGEFGIYASPLTYPLFKITSEKVTINNSDEEGNPISSEINIPSELLNAMKQVQDYLQQTTKEWFYA